MEDLMIIELFFARNEQAINETDVKYGRLCFGIANHILSNDEDAKECVNDTYLSVWNKIPPTRPNDFKSFICKIVRNLSIKKLEYNLALKRSKNMTVSYSELENVLQDNDIYDETDYINIGEIISVFLRHEKEESRNVFIRKYFFLILSVILQGDIHFQKARSKVCCTTLETD